MKITRPLFFLRADLSNARFMKIYETDETRETLFFVIV